MNRTLLEVGGGVDTLRGGDGARGRGGAETLKGGGGGGATDGGVENKKSDSDAWDYGFARNP